MTVPRGTVGIDLQFPGNSMIPRIQNNSENVLFWLRGSRRAVGELRVNSTNPRGTVSRNPDSSPTVQEFLFLSSLDTPLFSKFFVSRFLSF